MKKFSFPRTKSPTDSFAQNSLRFGRRAKRGELNISSLVLEERLPPPSPWWRFRSPTLQSFGDGARAGEL